MALGIFHFLPSGGRWVANEYACGADAVGRRQREEFDPANTTCAGCLKALAGAPCEAGIRTREGERATCTLPYGHGGGHSFRVA